jgi:glycosyltransferase involved in cell wall biosynthesis
MRFAVITPVYNEADLLPQFLDHYHRHGADHIVVCDNLSDDGTRQIAARPYTSIFSWDSSGKLCDTSKAKMVNRIAREFSHYDYLIIVDGDEFVQPVDNRTILQTLEDHPGIHAFPTYGIVVVQGPTEKPYDPTLPLLEQRHYGHRARLVYHKPCIFRPGAIVGVGQHDINVPIDGPPVFRLLHQEFVDEGIYLRRRMKMAQRQTEKNMVLGYGRCYKYKNEDHWKQKWDLRVKIPLTLYDWHYPSA